jgi:putative DNA primase/helicase
MIAGNHKPVLRGVDRAIRDRILMIPWSVTIPYEERNAHLFDDLKEEWPQILHWAFDGWALWQRVGLAPPKAVTDATKEYLDAEDRIRAWLDDRVNLGPQATAGTNALFKDFREWCDATGEFAGSKRAFSQSLITHSFEPYPSKTMRGFKGLELKFANSGSDQKQGSFSERS